MCEIQDDRHKADENKVGASNDAQKERSLSKFGTAQDHLEEHLRIKRRRRVVNAMQNLLPEGAEGYCRRAHLPGTCHGSGTGPLLSVYHIRQHRQQGRGDQSSPSKYSYLSRNLLDRDIAARHQQPNAHISHASLG